MRRGSAIIDSVVNDLGYAAVDGVVLDIGVSSMQLDQAHRGFSFRTDGPLDMRMESSGHTAADLVNDLDETTLAAVLYRFGEERDSRRIARAVVHDRVATPFTTTKQFADLVGRIVRGSPKGVHPATRSFQALRIAVNDELGQLLNGLAAAERMLREGGVLAVVTFHSLEDRIVKRFLVRAAGRGEAGSRHRPGLGARVPASFTLPPGQPVTPGEAELRINPRARSAKLRWAVRTAAPPLGLKMPNSSPWPIWVRGEDERDRVLAAPQHRGRARSAWLVGLCLHGQVRDDSLRRADPQGEASDHVPNRTRSTGCAPNGPC